MRYIIVTGGVASGIGKGMIFSGISCNENIHEIVELKEHKFYIGCQYHPEYITTPLNSHPLFMSLIGSAISFSNRKS